MKNTCTCPNCGKTINEPERGQLCACECGAQIALCSDCGEIFNAHELAEVNRKLLCNDCLRNGYSVCDCCDEYDDDENFYPVRNERGDTLYYCQSCIDYGHAQYCDDCHEYYTRTIETRGGRTVCCDCIDNYYYCNECGEYVDPDEWDDENECCCDCAPDDRVGSYHSHHNRWMKFGDYKAQWRGSWRGMGIELEIDRDDNDSDAENDLISRIEEIAPDRIYFERDGSLDNGFEIITHPHTIDEFYKIKWSEILRECVRHNYLSHDAGTCGLHIHLSRELFSSNQQKQDDNIAKLITFYEIFWNDIVKLSRRTSEQCNRWSGRYNETDKKETKKLVKNGNWERYRAVNLTNAKTVEIRIMRGTLKESTFFACIDFVLTTAKNANKIKWKDIASVERWLDGINENTKNYINERGAF